jgi:hypothetical protein
VWYASEGGMDRPSRTKSLGHSRPANHAGRRVGPALYRIRPHLTQDIFWAKVAAKYFSFYNQTGGCSSLRYHVFIHTFSHLIPVKGSRVLEWALNTASFILILLLLLSADWTAFPADRTAFSADRTIFPADWTPYPADQGALAAPSTSGNQNRTAKTTVLHDQPISKVRVICFLKQRQLTWHTQEVLNKNFKVLGPVRCYIIYMACAKNKLEGS